jgi:hypothetical protein
VANSPEEVVQFAGHLSDRQPLENPPFTAAEQSVFSIIISTFRKISC